MIARILKTNEEPLITGHSIHFRSLPNVGQLIFWEGISYKVVEIRWQPMTSIYDIEFVPEIIVE